MAPDLDLELANDALAGLIYWRMIVIGGRIESAYLEKLARFILAAFRSFEDAK